MKLTVLDENGTSHDLNVPTGQSVMQAIRDAGMEIAAQCGGCCACATCHVYVNDEWLGALPAPQDDELAMLELAQEPLPTSRLSCQIQASDELSGLTVTLAPGSSLF